MLPLVVCVCALLLLPSILCQAHPFFSAYTEKGNDKAVSVYNPSSSPIDMYDYAVIVGSTPLNLEASVPTFQRLIRFDSFPIPPGHTFTLASLAAQIAIQISTAPPNLGILSNDVTFNGDDWILLVRYNHTLLMDGSVRGIVQVMDVIGDTAIAASSSNKPYADKALSRHPSIPYFNLPSLPFATSNNYKWNTSEWTEMNFDTTDFGFLATHFSDAYECSTHDACPAAGFCTTSSVCDACAACVFDADGIDGTCPARCPTVCGGATPSTACPACRDTLYSFNDVTVPPTITPTSAFTARISFCAKLPFDYPSAFADADVAAIKLSLYYPASPLPTTDIRSFSFSSNEVVVAGTGGDLTTPLKICSDADLETWYVLVDNLLPNQRFTAQVKLFAECQTPYSPTAPDATTAPAPPSWQTSMTDDTLIVPTVAGSTSSLAVIQWKQPILNCPACTILSYNVTMTATSSPSFAELITTQTTTQNLVIFRDLVSTSTYTFTVLAQTVFGWSVLSPASPPFQVAAEPPDAAAYVLFATDEANPNVAVQVSVIIGNTNGAMIDLYEVEYWPKGGREDSRTVAGGSSVFNVGEDVRLKPSTRYGFVARLRNTAGTSPASDVYYYKTSATMMCDARDFTVAPLDEFCTPSNGRRVDFVLKEGAVCDGGEEAVRVSEYLPCEYVPYVSMPGYTIVGVSIFGFVVCFSTTIFFILHRNKPIIKAAQPVFLILFTFAAAVFVGSTALRIGPINYLTCKLQMWVPHISFAVSFGSLVVKLWRVYKIFASKDALMLKRVKVTPCKAIFILLVMISVDVAILSAWRFLDPPREQDMDITWQLQNYYGSPVTVKTCASNTNYGVYGITVYNLALIIGGCYMTFKTRKVSRKLAEKREVIYVVYMTAMLALITGVVTTPGEVPENVKMVLVSITSCLGCVTACGIFLLPKLIQGLDTEITGDDLELKEVGTHRNRRESKRGSTASTGGKGGRASTASTLHTKSQNSEGGKGSLEMPYTYNPSRTDAGL